MRRLFGGRTAVEAVFLIAVPITALAAGLSALWIIVASALAYGLVLAFEGLHARGSLPTLPKLSSLPPLPKLSLPQLPERPHRVPRERPPAEAVGAGEEATPTVVVVPTPAPAPDLWAPEPELEPEPRAEPERPPREPEPAPAPAPVSEPETVLRAVPPPAPEPAPVVRPVAPPVADTPREPAPEPEPPAAVPIEAGAQPRQWNVWELERVTREHAGADPGRDEERTFLLLYLRDFADPNGLLPLDFDGLVRESFGDLVGAG